MLGLLVLLGVPAAAAQDPSALPKIVIVVAGDPDAALRAEAERIEALLRPNSNLTLPEDALLRAALRGEEGEADDGLERLRRDRRGLLEGDGHALLARIGHVAGAAAVVVVSRSHGGFTLAVFDTGRTEYFEGEPVTTEGDQTISAFILSRARAAQRHSRDDGTASVPTGMGAGAEREPSPSDNASWFEDNWMFLAGGAALALIVTLVALSSGSTDETGPPVLRFVAD